MARRESVDIPEWNPTKRELDLFEEWRNNTIQHLVNHKNGVQPHRLPAMLEERFDERIPIYKMGLRVWHINHFLYQMASDIEIRKNYENGRLYIFLVESSVPKHLLHIRQMVLGQRDDKDGALRYSLRRVSCNELLKNGRMPNTQPVAGQSYPSPCGTGVSRCTNSKFVLRETLGPNSTVRKELVRLNSSARVANFCEGKEDWGIPSTNICSNNAGTLKMTFSRQPVPVLGTRMANVPKSEDEVKASVTNSTAESTSKETSYAKNDKASTLDFLDMDMDIHYEYSIDSIDLDMGVPYSYQTTMLGGNQIPPKSSSKSKIRFTPYLTGNRKTFKEYLQEIGELEEFMSLRVKVTFDS